MGLRPTHRSPNLGQKIKPKNNQQKKRIWKIVDFAVSADHRIKLKECEKKDKNREFARELEKNYEIYNNRNWCIWNSNKRITKRTGGLGRWRRSGYHPNYCIIENGQNTKKSPGDLRRLDITQTPVKDHQLTLMWKTLMSKW